MSEPAAGGNGVSEDLSVLVGGKYRSRVSRLILTVLSRGRQFLCGEPSPTTSFEAKGPSQHIVSDIIMAWILDSRTIAVTGKALVVRVDAEDDLSDWLKHSSDRFGYLTDQELLGSLVFGDPLYWVESGLADCAVVQLGVLDYCRNDVAHQLLL